MMKLCLMASHGHPPSSLFTHEQSMSKDYQPMVPVPVTGSRQTILGPDSLNLRTVQFDSPMKLDGGFPLSGHNVKDDSMFSKLIPLDSIGNFRAPVQFSQGIAEKCTRHEEVSKFLSSAENGMENLDLSDLSDLVDFQVTITNMQRNQATSSSRLQSHGSRAETKPSFLYPAGMVDAQEQLAQFLEKHIPNPAISINSDGKISFVGSVDEMKDLLSVLEEFYLPRWSKPTMLVPQFDCRANAIETQISVNHAGLQLETLRFAPLRSPEKVKVKQPQRRKSKKKTEGAHVYEKNYSRACETFLSVMMDRNRSGKSVIRSLKKSGTELPHLLNQISTSIAGTGLAIIFSVICKVLCGRASVYSTSKVLSVSIGIGMFWLSWAVNKLNKTVVDIRKSPAKLGFKEEKDMIRRVDKGINDIFFRAATVTAIAMLKLA